MAFEKQRGQILLIVILVIIVASTIGLSLASRTITSLRSSTEEAESQKALAAAEAGIERATQGGVPIALPEQTVNNSGGGKNSAYSTTVAAVSSFSFLLNGWTPIMDPNDPNKVNVLKMIPNTVPKDEGVDVWFVEHNSDGSLGSPSSSTGNINLYWGTTSEKCNGSAPAAIEVIVVAKESSGTIKSYKYAYDSCNRGNNFNNQSSPGAYTVPGIVGVTFGNRTPDGDLAKNIGNIVLMRVIPIYKDTVIGINACDSSNPPVCASLPSQGYIITSTGTSGQASRKITVFKGYPQTYLPYLSYGLFVAN